MILKFRHSLFIILLVGLAGCNDSQRAADTPDPIAIEEEIEPVKFDRFDRRIGGLGIPVKPEDVQKLRSDYGKFFELWCTQLAGIIPPGDTAPSNAEIAFNLSQYLGDKYIREVNLACQKEFDDLEELETEMSEVMKRYEMAFPGRTAPQLVCYISPFSSNVMTLDSVLGIGLHFYLGQDYKYYPSLELPLYMVKKFRREFIVNDLVRGWLDSEYFDDSAQVNCLSQMIYQGKVLYAMDVLSPETHDTIKTGFSETQLTWAENHEKELWTFFIEQKLIYNTNPKIYLKYIQDGNTTSGFPKEAPARLGPFIGWKIVRAYMKSRPETDLKSLFETRNAQDILTGSGYKPSKKTD